MLVIVRVFFIESLGTGDTEPGWLPCLVLCFGVFLSCEDLAGRHGGWGFFESRSGGPVACWLCLGVPMVWVPGWGMRGTCEVLGWVGAGGCRIPSEVRGGGLGVVWDKVFRGVNVVVLFCLL